MTYNNERVSNVWSTDPRDMKASAQHWHEKKNGDDCKNGNTAVGIHYIISK